MPLYPTRLIVVSDLHLGGERPVMMSHPSDLGRFIDGLPRDLAADERLELAIAGDFVDYLAIAPHASWTPEPARAAEKLVRTMADGSLFAPAFAALGRHVAGGHRLTILIGNHDVELGLPRVQSALLKGIGAAPHEVRFVDNNHAYRVGGVLIEHGNRYDEANVNDWTGLRAIAAAQSRNEEDPVELEISAGSQIVERVVNELKPRYPFIDLLQPQGDILVFLLLAFEPSLKWHADKIGRILHGKYLQGKNAQGLQPGKTRNVTAEAVEMPERDLQAAFGEAYSALRRPTRAVSASDWLNILIPLKADSLSQLIERGASIPPERLHQMRLCMRRMLLNDRSLDRDGPTEQYGKAAQRLLGGDVETVIMGHTHLARHIGPPEHATYINTGTWADLVRVPEVALGDGATADEALAAFLRNLLFDENVRQFKPSAADLRINADGHVTHAALLEVTT